jgi:hypothetical protein
VGYFWVQIERHLLNQLVKGRKNSKKIHDNFFKKPDKNYLAEESQKQCA